MELVSILFLLIGLGLMLGLRRILLEKDNRTTLPYISTLSAILFLLFWNSEYIAASILIFGVLHSLQSSSSEDSLQQLFRHVLYVLAFAFVLRKVKDTSMQYFIEMNLQNIK